MAKLQTEGAGDVSEQLGHREDLCSRNWNNQYASQLNFRNGILVAGIVTMIIALFGLVGYTSDEVNRRRKEIAIRKVNGAKVKDILRIFLKDIMKIALPCIIVGDFGGLADSQTMAHVVQREDYDDAFVVYRRYHHLARHHRAFRHHQLLQGGE